MKTIISKAKNVKKLSLVVLSVLVVACAIYFVCLYISSQSQSSNNSVASNVSNTQANTDSAKENNDKVVHFAAMGDMLAHDTIIANAKTDKDYDFAKYFSNIKKAYSESEVVFCNQEGLSSGESYGISGYPSFNAPKQFAYDLRNGANCNLINLANNHIGDKGTAAIGVTIDYWSSLHPLGFSGANKSASDQEKVSYFTMDGIKVGFLAFADFSNNKAIPSYSVNIYHDQELVNKLVSEARKNSDVVIVSMHWGVEDSNVVSLDQTNQVNLLNSLGVDIVIGTGPHVLQKVDVVKSKSGHKTVVWYSIGNMLSSQLNIKELIGGIAKMDIKLSSDNKLTVDNLTFVPTYMHYEWSAAEAASGDLLKRKNAMIYLLDDADAPLKKSLFNTTVTEQKDYVKATIGNKVTIQ